MWGGFMFRIRRGKSDEVLLEGRFDASQVDVAREVFDLLTETTVVDFSELEYISSGGLGVILGAEKRLQRNGHHLKLTNLNRHIRELFSYAGLDVVFKIE
jgi:anti-sigma B factor antagonist